MGLGLLDEPFELLCAVELQDVSKLALRFCGK
jgi:hypothetical protein